MSLMKKSDVKNRLAARDRAKIIWPNWLPRVLWFRRACPCCESIRFKPGELHSLDGLCAMFALRPVRCMFCWRRYYWFSLRNAG
jgi:hypothetical protein